MFLKKFKKFLKTWNMSVQIPNSALADLYALLNMLEDLLKAHKANDIVIYRTCDCPKDISERYRFEII